MDPFDLDSIEHDELATELWTEDRKQAGTRHNNEKSKPSDAIWLYIGIAILIWVISSVD